MGAKPLPIQPKRHTTSKALSGYSGPAFASRPAHFKSLSLFLSSCTITSSLGCKQPPHELQFTSFFSEDPLIAIFALNQDFHIPVSRRHKLAYRRHHDECFALSLLTQLFPCCKASVVVETRNGRWEYKVSSRSIKWCSWQHGVLLLDWQALYLDCFEEEQRRRKKAEGKKWDEEVWAQEPVMAGGASSYMVL